MFLDNTDQYTLAVLSIEAQDEIHCTHKKLFYSNTMGEIYEDRKLTRRALGHKYENLIYITKGNNGLHALYTGMLKVNLKPTEMEGLMGESYKNTKDRYH